MPNLAIKYRPTTWEGVVGQDAIVSSLQPIIEEGETKAFLFHGPSGVGKTTLARIAAKELGCLNVHVQEVDGATHTKVDDWRAITKRLPFLIPGTKSKVIIVDECHMLSRNAWNSLLKSVEEPPKHVYWFFCTTELRKVPDTIKTRCASYQLGSVKKEALIDLLVPIAEVEEGPSQEICQVVAKYAYGSPRDALVKLDQCWDCETRADALKLLKQLEEEEGAPISLAKALVEGRSWGDLMKIVKSLKDEHPESIRIVVANYLTAVVMNKTSPDQAFPALNLLSAFSTPYPPGDTMAPLLLSIGEALSD